MRLDNDVADSGEDETSLDLAAERQSKNKKK